MSLVGLVEDIGADVINTVGDIDIGKENINGIFSNLTLLSLLLTSLRGNVVKGRTSFDDEYDYIIIGGGTAGSIMASRLSQHPCVRVLLLEAGGEQPILTAVPGLARLFLGTDIDWSYYTVPQRHCCFGQKERRALWNNGRVLGGSSVINAMLYVRGNKENFNQWAREGAEGWHWDAVFPYFLKLEDNHNMDDVDQGYHNQGGPMGAQKANYHPALKEHATQAMKDMGWDMTDINGRRQTGIYDTQGTLRNQERCSTARAYLKPASNRPNLHIVTHAFVRKILINRRYGNRAFGVVFEHNKKIHVARIGRSDYIRGGCGEIIVANGAVRAPQTLMLSGIGPREHLEEFRIPVIADLPVGKNLQDHYAAGMLYELSPIVPTVVLKQIKPDTILRYIMAREGPQCSICQHTILGFVKGLNATYDPDDFPLIQMYWLEYNTEDAIKTVNLEKDVEEKVYAPYILSPTTLCWSQPLQPWSRGEITLNSHDPHEYPNIDPKYYSHPRDVELAVEGMKICQAVAKHQGMKGLGMKWVHQQKSGYPGCEEFEGNEDEYLACIARSVVYTIWHFSGTCRMGDPRDPRSVVDPQLRVIGVDKLRVVNAGVMPYITSGNTNVPTMMIAEKAYDMIKDNIMCRSAVTIRGDHEVPDES